MIDDGSAWPEISHSMVDVCNNQYFFPNTLHRHLKSIFFSDLDANEYGVQLNISCTNFILDIYHYYVRIAQTRLAMTLRYCSRWRCTYTYYMRDSEHVEFHRQKENFNGKNKSFFFLRTPHFCWCFVRMCELHIQIVNRLFLGFPTNRFLFVLYLNSRGGEGSFFV